MGGFSAVGVNFLFMILFVEALGFRSYYLTTLANREVVYDGNYL